MPKAEGVFSGDGVLTGFGIGEVIAESDGSYTIVIGADFTESAVYVEADHLHTP